MGSTVAYLGDQATAVGDNKVRRRTDFPCRSVYLPVIRNDLPELLEAFDFADPHFTTGMRPETMVAPQGLFMLNDEMVMHAAETTARRLLACQPCGNAESRADILFQWLFQEPPSQLERDAIVRFVKQVQSEPAPVAPLRSLGREQLLSFFDQLATSVVSSSGPEAEVRAWSMACHALFASSRFQIME
jgi:hypothetical protein